MMVKLSSRAAKALFMGAFLAMMVGVGRGFKSIVEMDYVSSTWSFCTAAWALMSIKLLYLCEELIVSNKAKSQRIKELRKLVKEITP